MSVNEDGGKAFSLSLSFWHFCPWNFKKALFFSDGEIKRKSFAMSSLSFSLFRDCPEFSSFPSFCMQTTSAFADGWKKEKKVQTKDEEEEENPVDRAANIILSLLDPTHLNPLLQKRTHLKSGKRGVGDIEIGPNLPLFGGARSHFLAK